MTFQAMRSLPPWQRGFATFAALAGWTALVVQLGLTLTLVVAQGRGWPMGLVVYFGFFTVLTNLLATLVLTAWRIGPAFAGYRLLASPVTVTTAATAITIVGLVYFFILRHTWKPEGTQFVADAALHYVMPVLFVIFWAWVVPARAIGWSRAPLLLLYPLIYLVYVFARGEITGLYPYGFIDVMQLGYPVALRNSLGLLVAYSLIAGIYVGAKAVLTGRSVATGKVMNERREHS